MITQLNELNTGVKEGFDRYKAEKATLEAEVKQKKESMSSSSSSGARGEADGEKRVSSSEGAGGEDPSKRAKGVRGRWFGSGAGSSSRGKH